ncbi:MAG: hypothetical protein O8C66_04580, partial [Candidatus Methanoperedens sp.]|nr:hypothetical protein [Candidatus Methanoperedens sp.]
WRFRRDPSIVSSNLTSPILQTISICLLWFKKGNFSSVFNQKDEGMASSVENFISDHNTCEYIREYIPENSIQASYIVRGL